MTWIIIQLIFPALLFVLPMALYKNPRRFMRRFYERMARYDKARKLHAQVLLVLLLLFHYVYTNVRPGEFGILLSTGVCAIMFSSKRVDRWLRRLLDRPRAFVTLSLIAVVTGFVPHLYTTAVAAAYLLLAALFYPSVRIMSECADNDIYKVFERVKHPETLAESYHDNHHAGLPHDADSGRPDTIRTISNHQKSNENGK